MSTRDCDRGDAPAMRDAWEYAHSDSELIDQYGEDGWEAYATVVLTDKRGQHIRHYLKRRVPR